MDELLKCIQYIRDNGPYVMNISSMLIGIFASFLSASLEKKVKIWGLFILSIVFNILTWIVYGEKGVLLCTIILTLIWIAACLFLICNREIISRKRIDKMIRNFTDDADQNKPICIFGGDINFFGDVVADVTRKDNFFKNKNIIQYNRQYNQIKDKGFREIRILCMKPDSDSDEDLKTKIRIGYLKENLKKNLEIKFFEEKECNDCPDREICLACNVCEDCPEGKICKRMGTKICPKLKENLQSRCFNPDTRLRGRIVKRKMDGSTSAAIVTTYKSGKSYILKEYSSNTKECTMYQNIWDVWWKKCKSDENFISQCIDEYKRFINAADKGSNKT